MSAVAARPATDRSEPGARAGALGVAAIRTSFAGLQIALAAGAPLGEHVWGGLQPTVLSGSMRDGRRRRRRPSSWSAWQPS